MMLLALYELLRTTLCTLQAVAKAQYLCMTILFTLPPNVLIIQ